MDSYQSIFSKWDGVKHGIPLESILDHFLFLIYINDVAKIITFNSKPVIFADDTGLIIMNPIPGD